MIQPQHKKSESKDLFVIQHFTQNRMDRELIIEEEETTRQTRHTLDVNAKKSKNLLGLVEVEKSPSAQKKPKIEEPIVEEQPDIISINEENLAPEENVDGYLEELREKYHEISQASSPVKTKDAESSFQTPSRAMDNLKSLQDSIVSSVTEVLQNLEESKREDVSMDQSQAFEDSDKIYLDDKLKLTFTDDFASEFYMGVHLEVMGRDLSPNSKKNYEIVKILKNKDWSDQDLVRIIDWNERRHRDMALKQLKENSVISLESVDTRAVKIRVLT